MEKSIQVISDIRGLYLEFYNCSYGREKLTKLRNSLNHQKKLCD